jgi:hypothetical protein
MKKSCLQNLFVSSFVTLVTLLFSSLSMGQSATPPCSNRTLQGDYAFAIEGAQVRGVAMTHFDGEGNLTQVDHVVINGVPPAVEWRLGTGSYTVNSDCTGSAQINNVGAPPLDLRFVIAAQGKEIRTVVNNHGALASSFGVKR